MRSAWPECGPEFVVVVCVCAPSYLTQGRDQRLGKASDRRGSQHARSAPGARTLGGPTRLRICSGAAVASQEQLHPTAQLAAVGVDDCELGLERRQRPALADEVGERDAGGAEQQQRLRLRGGCAVHGPSTPTDIGGTSAARICGIRSSVPSGFAPSRSQCGARPSGFERQPTSDSPLTRPPQEQPSHVTPYRLAETGCREWLAWANPDTVVTSTRSETRWTQQQAE